jgi:hypothetical protein
MKRSALNYLIDAAAFVAFLFLLSTGLLLRYQLPPGSGGLEGRGSGRGTGDRAVTQLWSWSRHDWGELHFWIAVVLIAVLALHLLLHWKWIVCMTRGTRSEASGLRFGLGLASLVALLILTIVPLVVPTSETTRDELREQTLSDGESDVHISATDWDHLRGSMTLAEAAAEGGMSVEYLREKLGLAENVLSDDRIGRSLREAGKHMSDLRRLLTEAAEEEARNEQKEIRP